MRKIRSLITALLLAVGLLNMARAATEPKWISLFDGKTLNGCVQEEGGYGRRGPSNWLAPRNSAGELLAEWNKKHGDPFKPAPAWNTCRIEVRGTHIKTWLNGHLLADFDDNADVRIPKGF